MRFPRLPALPRPLLRALSVLPLPLLTTGWFVNGEMSTIHVDGPVAQAQYEVFEVTLWVTLFIFVTVGAFLAYATWKFRARTAADEHAEPPPQSHGNPLVEMGLIVASVLLLVIIAVPTLRAIWYTHRIPEQYQGQLMTIKATGYQWWFKFEYPDLAAELPDGNRMPLTTANELVIPVDTPIRIDLRTVDVIHSFWLPKLAGKVDMIPNRGNFLWLKASKTGYYWGQCAEFCGESHGLMRFRAVVLSKEEFAAWAQRQARLARTPGPATAAGPAPAPAAPERPQVRFAGYIVNSHEGELFDVWQDLQQPPASGEDPALIARGRELFRQKTCIGCHTVRGHEGVGITGPDLTHFGTRTTVAAGILDNTPENLKRWIQRPNEVKPGNKMWHGGYVDAASKAPIFTVDDAEADALVAYLRSLR